MFHDRLETSRRLFLLLGCVVREIHSTILIVRLLHGGLSTHMVETNRIPSDTACFDRFYWRCTATYPSSLTLRLLTYTRRPSRSLARFAHSTGSMLLLILLLTEKSKKKVGDLLTRHNISEKLLSHVQHFTKILGVLSWK